MFLFSDLPFPPGSSRVLRRMIWLGFFVLLLAQTPLLAQSEVLSITPEIQFQRMEGFGVSIGNGAAREIESMPESDRAKLLDLLFGADTAHLNILRNEVWWTGKRFPFTSPLYQSGLTFNFSDEPHESAQYSLVREAQKGNVVIMNSCVWTPPPQWKSNQSPFQGGELLEKNYENYADYLLGYLRYYKGMRNLDVQLLSLQNSPDKGLSTQSCQWSNNSLKEFLKLVGRRLKEVGFSTGITLPETGWGEALPYLDPILQDNEARPLISRIGIHSTEASQTLRAQVRDIAKRQNIKLWQTEYFTPRESGVPPMEQGLALAERLIKDLSEADCQAWLYWAAITPPGWDKREGLLDRDGKSFKTSKRFWCFRQFSRFISKDSVRVGVSGANLPVVCFRTPEYKGIILVLVNSSPKGVSVGLGMRGWTLEKISLYRTSEKEDGVQVPIAFESGSQQNLTLEPQSVTTLVAQLRRVRN
jgi:glucosylceramidase